MIEWKPIDVAPRQTMVLVGHEAFRGWFEIAEYMITVGWVKRGTQTRLDREPTHFASIDPPPFTNYVSGSKTQQ
jgi:hypothetical protein